MQMSALEENIRKSLQDHIFNSVDLGELIASYGFTHVSRGTFISEQGLFLYDKPQFGATTLEQARKNLRVAQYLTRQGVLFPNTSLGICKNDAQVSDDQYQLFAVTRALDVSGPTKTIPLQKVKMNYYIPENPVCVVEWSEFELNLFPAENWYAHPMLIELFRRLDPNFYLRDFGRTESLAELGNPTEAAWADNWGIDSSTGIFYPVDIEVIGFGTPRKERIVNTWCENVCW